MWCVAGHYHPGGVGPLPRYQPPPGACPAAVKHIFLTWLAMGSHRSSTKPSLPWYLPALYCRPEMKAGPLLVNPLQRHLSIGRRSWVHLRDTVLESRKGFSASSSPGWLNTRFWLYPFRGPLPFPHYFGSGNAWVLFLYTSGNCCVSILPSICDLYTVF